MQTTQRWLTLVGIMLIALLSIACPNSVSPSPCCGDPNNAATTSVAFSSIIASNANQVPQELQGCGVNHEEIIAIEISGRLSGCLQTNSVGLTFPNLQVDFTTSGMRCNGPPADRPQRRVLLVDVKYTGDPRAHLSPACIQSSSVDFMPLISSGEDPDFMRLFATRGPQTLLPILDRFVLGWATSNPAVTCPVSLTFAGATGTTSRCPS